jgi:hypothetical protein
LFGIKEISERVAFGFGAFHHFLETIFSDDFGVVRVDGNNREALGVELAVEVNDALLVQLGIGAMVAGKNQDEALSVGVAGKRDHTVVHVAQGELLGPVANDVVAWVNASIEEQEGASQKDKRSDGTFHNQ